MKLLSIEAFVPSGNDFEASKKLFQELGFAISWDGGDYVGLERDGCKFILQKFAKQRICGKLHVKRESK